MLFATKQFSFCYLFVVASLLHFIVVSQRRLEQDDSLDTLSATIQRQREIVRALSLLCMMFLV